MPTPTLRTRVERPLCTRPAGEYYMYMYIVCRSLLTVCIVWLFIYM